VRKRLPGLREHVLRAPHSEPQYADTAVPGPDNSLRHNTTRLTTTNQWGVFSQEFSRAPPLTNSN
jgi:hypothetical protein